MPDGHQLRERVMRNAIGERVDAIATKPLAVTPMLRCKIFEVVAEA